MKRQIEKQAMEVVKSRARALGITQAKTAAELGVSLPTVKRWWGGTGVNLSVLNRLCALVGISLSQIFLELEGSTLSYTYSPEQEKMLANNPKVLALFDLLVSGEDVSSIRRQFSIPVEEMFNLLLKLDRVGLIELHEQNRIKLRRSGEPQWIVGGLLSLKYRKRMIEEFLGEHKKSDMTFFIHNYLPEDVVLLKGKIKELEGLMLSCNVRGNMESRDRRSFGAYLALKEFEWDLRNQLRR